MTGIRNECINRYDRPDVSPCFRPRLLINHPLSRLPIPLPFAFKTSPWPVLFKPLSKVWHHAV